MTVATTPHGQWESPITSEALSYNSVFLNAPRSSVSSSILLDQILDESYLKFLN
jgi:hypothetical protein